MKLEIPAYVRTLMNDLNAHSYECYIVGGAVRSLLLGLPVHDYDLTTNALPEQMKEVFKDHKTIETGLKHGTLTVLSQHHPVEITTYRKDAAYQDHRHPDAVQFTSAIEEDCARRDFTVNAFCYSDETGILDFFHGREDLENHILRCIGDPEKRFDEDALRILRAIRFASQLDFQIEESTKKAIFEKKDLLSYISYERIREEMKGLLQAKKCALYFDTYRSVMHVFFPEIIAIPHWNAVLADMDRAEPDADVRMAVLLSELSDPAAILRRLKYPKQDIRLITAMIDHRHDPLTDRIALRRFLSAYSQSFDAYLNFRQALDPSFSSANVKACHEKILADNDCFTIGQLQVNGADAAACGYQKEQISAILAELLNAVIEEKIKNSREDLLAYMKKEDH
ncbi:MAG: CCA tRNA nucleotidyltransferase [Erysipelotrichaceae bacterium]|nr:CCA tRNA nucleotidyltransferase [Erysipelotrichaceae bacterium]